MPTTTNGPQVSDAAPPAARVASIDVLIIDDEPFVRGVLEKALQKAGYGVVSAVDGKSGLTLLAKHAFKLVITDIFMPDMDGYEVIMRINSKTPKPVVLAISGGAMNLAGEALRTAKLLGCRGILAKPFDLAEIYKVVSELIGPPAGPEATG